MTAALLPIGKYEFRDVDYRQILIWAQALELAPMEIVQRIEDSYSDNPFWGTPRLGPGSRDVRLASEGGLWR